MGAVLFQHIQFLLQFIVVLIYEALVLSSIVVSIYHNNNSMFILNIWLGILLELAIVLLTIRSIPYFNINWRLIFVQKLKLLNVRNIYWPIQLHGTFCYIVALLWFFLRWSILFVSYAWSAIRITYHAWLWPFVTFIFLIQLKFLFALNIFRYQTGLASTQFSNYCYTDHEALIFRFSEIFAYIFMKLCKRAYIWLPTHKRSYQIRLGCVIFWWIATIVYVANVITIYDFQFASLSVATRIFEAYVWPFKIIFAFNYYIFIINTCTQVVLMIILLRFLNLRWHRYQPIDVLFMCVFNYHFIFLFFLRRNIFLIYIL